MSIDTEVMVAWLLEAGRDPYTGASVSWVMCEVAAEVMSTTAARMKGLLIGPSERLDFGGLGVASLGAIFLGVVLLGAMFHDSRACRMFLVAEYLLGLCG
jgi:hypothetical protein